MSQEFLHLTDANFESEVTKSDKPVVVDFFATWCGPCNAVAPIFKQLAEENSKVKFVKVDIDDAGAQGIVNQFNIQGVPTFIFFKNGEQVERFSGMRPKAVFEEAMKKLF